MRIPSGLAKSAAVVIFLAICTQSNALELPADAGAPSGADAAPESMLTDRLNARQLKIWKAIERIALAADRFGNPVHPRIHDLWQRAQPSRHQIHVEINDRGDARDCSAAEFRIEKPSDEAHCGVAVIRLNLPVIHSAGAKKWIDGSARSTSLGDLGNHERYAAIFGHELLHAFMILEDPEYACLYQEYARETAAYYLARRNKPSKVFSSAEMQARLQRLQSLMDQLEKPVNLIEGEIWRELKMASDRKY